MSMQDPLLWQPGQELPTLTLEPVTRLALIKYAGASCDFNPIHTIDQAATDAGLPGIIQHGMLTMASIARLFSPHLASGFIQHYDIRFTGMVFLHDVLTISGTITTVEQTTFAVAYHCDVSATNQHGKAVATGTITFQVTD